MSVVMSAEIKVVGVECSPEVKDIGEAASKALMPGNRYRYFHQVKYVLEDGTAVESIIRGITKPKLKNRVASTKENIANGMMFAQTFDYGDGPSWSFVTKYYIGPR